ncbi:molybdopterin-synthase adenylyltransferase MoeB [Actinomyces trachealis]|uniref:molybdopterin-synthase adenylyltransferase MoeB n=1 Tax=Actinomyces trachealis TaxID=2763540 RepID=UPI0018C80959
MTHRDGIWEAVVDDSRRKALSAAERERYARNILVPEVGTAGQERIRAARVLIVGVGGLGSPVALYLAAAGVGTLGLVDPDVVEISNLQRQVLHSTEAVGTLKTASAHAALTALNPDVAVVAVPERVTEDNALEVLGGWDVVVDATDNVPVRYLLGDTTVRLGVPFVHGAVLGTYGQVGVFDVEHGPCYRCLRPVPPPAGSVPTGVEAGVLGVLPGVIGSVQAAEVLKLVVGGARPLIGRLLVFDAWGARVDEVRVTRHPDCPVCGPHAAPGRED